MRCVTATGFSVLIVTAGLLHPDGLVSAQSGALDHSPAEVVKRYVTLDQKGARLDSMSFEALVPYIDWQEEPAWGRMVVIQDAVVPDDYRRWQVVDRFEVVIPVTFRLLGAVYLETAAFVPEERTEEIRFRVKAVRNRWRIVEPMIPPHIGLKRLQNFVRESELKESDSAQRSMLTALGEELRKAK